MPQMAPISWLILFFVFCFTFILFNIMNYFCFFKSFNLNNTSNNNNNNKKYTNMNWKW